MIGFATSLLLKPLRLSLSKPCPFLWGGKKDSPSTGSGRAVLGTRGVLGALALVAMPALAHAQARTPETVLMSENERARAVQERYGFSDAVIAGDTIYLSGIVAGRAPGETGFTPAFERVFRQVERILRRAGATLADIVDVTSFHTDIVPEVEAMSEVQKRLLGSPPPAWTAIQVERLLPENGIAEIKIVARRSGAAAPAPGRN